LSGDLWLWGAVFVETMKKKIVKKAEKAEKLFLLNNAM